MTNKKKDDDFQLTKSGNSFASQPLRDKIGTNLKKIYDDVVQEEIPEEFLSLLQQADTK